MSGSERGVDMARWFLTEHAAGSAIHGPDGIEVSREGCTYTYLWLDATVNDDVQMHYLLDVRTDSGAGETRDCLYVTDGFDGFECEWRNKPIRWDAAVEAHIENGYEQLRWFIGLVDEHRNDRA